MKAPAKPRRVIDRRVLEAIAALVGAFRTSHYTESVSGQHAQPQRLNATTEQP